MTEWTDADLDHLLSIQTECAAQVGEIPQYQIVLSLLIALVALCDGYDHGVVSGDEVYSFLLFTARLPFMPPLPSEDPELYMQEVDDSIYTPDQKRAFRFAFHRIIETLAKCGESSFSEESLKSAVLTAFLMTCRDYEAGKADAAGVVVLGELFDQVG